MFTNRTFKVSLLAVFAGVVILGFQNCAPTKFKEAPSVSGLSFSAGAADSDIVSEDPSLTEPQSDDQSEPRPSDAISSIGSAQPPTEMPKDDAPVKEKDPEVAGDKSDEAPPIAKAPVVEDSESAEDEESFVECDLGRPNSKVTLSGILKKGSNASSSRVCMSENACLKIVNAFAAKRDCSLAKGAAVSDSQADQQCTQIFPGSRGTCKNASKVSDDEVAAILKGME